MIKKLLLSLFLVLPMMASAQLGAGQWKIHPYFIGTNIKNCYDAGNKVYYLASGSLFCYDKTAQTNKVVDATNSLSDVEINQIYYDYSKQNLFVVFNDCNIDVIHADGSVSNISALKDVVMHGTKKINDIAFSNGKVFVATSFGYLVLDNTNFSVKEVRNYDTNVTSVAEIGNIKVMSLNKNFYYCNVDEQVETIDAYKQVANSKGDGRIYPINDNKFFLTCIGTLQVETVETIATADGDSCTFTAKQELTSAPTTVQHYPGGFVVSVPNKGHYYTFNSDGGGKDEKTGNEIYTSQEESNNWWVLGANGLAHIVNGVKGDYIKPNGISITANAYYSTYDPGMHRVIINRTTDNFVLDALNNGGRTEINSFNGSAWQDITPTGAPQGLNNDAGGNTDIVVSPNEPNTYFYCLRISGGVVKVKNDTVVARYKATNSPVTYRVGLKFDSKGNLWMPLSKSPSNETETGYRDAFVITPENQLIHGDAVNPEKFIINDMGGACHSVHGGYKRFAFGIGAGDTKVFTPGEYNEGVVFWNNNDDLSVKQYKVISSFTDQEGKDYKPWGWLCFKDDQDGIIWAGSVDGVISFNPSEAFNDDFTVNRIKYTKNQGYEGGGILLEATQVNSIDVDAQNCKWIGSNTSGVYFVSPDGSEIYKHFDSSNSPLPSDQVYSVCCNHATNSVMMVTPKGVVEYFPGITPSQDDYSNVYASPSLVEPDFTGMVSINGLMSNSNVVITDGDGNTVKTLTSTGGIALWDLSDETGAHVKTGYYKVYASQATPDTTGDPLTKIAIIK